MRAGTRSTTRAARADVIFEELRKLQEQGMGAGFGVATTVPQTFSAADIAETAREQGFACYRIRGRPTYCLLDEDEDGYVCIKCHVGAHKTYVATRLRSGPRRALGEILDCPEEEVERL
jgi:hypothetical protein